jgi:hypothetical protein
MKQEDSFFADTRQKAQEYVKERIMLFKMELLEKVSKVAAGMLSVMFLVLIVFFIVFFLSIMTGYYFASLTGSLFYGFAIVAGIYILLLIIFLLIKKKVIDVRITNALIDVFFDKTEIEEDEQPK